jgi:nucleoside-diphosphate-sugar epimerase
MLNHNSNYLSAYAGASVLVLGATGFIGRWVAKHLCVAGAKLILPVRNSVAANAIFRDYGIFGELCEADLLDQSDLESLYNDFRPAITFNLAGYGIDRTEQDRKLAFATNSELVKDVCKAAHGRCDERPGLRQIVHVGSAMEYGRAGGILEEGSLAFPTTLYGESKLAGTQSLTKFCRKNGLRGVTARLFAVYGPGESRERLVPTLIENTGEAIPLTAGMHKRDFVYVEDVAEGLLRLGVSDAVPGEVVNFATGRLTSIRAFVETAADVIGIDRTLLQFGSLPTRAEEMVHEPVTNRRLYALTGWTPRVTIPRGISRTMSFRKMTLRENRTGQLAAVR